MPEPDNARTPSSDSPIRSRNSIRPAAARLKRPASAEETSRGAAGRSAAPAKDEIPEAVRKRFVQVRNRFYFPDGARAFTDRGSRLTTPSENTEVVRSLIAIAKAREWNEITVRGTERFRREAWVAGRLAGLEVRGYKPSEVEQAQLVRTLSRQNGVTAGEASDGPVFRGPQSADNAKSTKRPAPTLLTGKLIEHGPATYQHDPRAAMSYFVKLGTPRGERIIWGVDLERAFKESLTRPQAGDEIGLRAVRQDAVKVKTPVQDAGGKVSGLRDLETHRNRWIIEKRAFFDSRAEAARTLRDATVDPKEAVKNNPALVGTYLQIRAAELAAKQFRDPEDRRRFVDLVRSSLADSVARGEALPAVRLRERGQERAPKTPEREAARVRG